MPFFILKVSPRAIFWIGMITTCQFLKNKVHKVSGLETKSTRCVKFWLESFTVSSFDLGFPQPVRLWTNKFAMWQILWEKSHNMSYSELQVIQRVWFWVVKSTTCQILRVKNFTKYQILFHEIQRKSVFELKNTKSVKFWKKLYSNFTWIILFRKIDMFCPLRAFSKAFFWKKNSVHCVRFVMKKIRTCQFLV